MSEPTPRRLHLLERHEEGADAWHCSFRIAWPQAPAPQAIPGQFFLLSVPGAGEAPFAYLSLPDPEGRFSALIPRGGPLGPVLSVLEEGAALGYRGPFGRGWPLLVRARRLLVASEGPGLAALAGVLDEALDWRLPTRLRVIHLSYQGGDVLGEARRRWRREIPFLEIADEAAFPGRLRELLADFRPDALFCSGSEPFMGAVAGECLRRGMAPGSIWLWLERRMRYAAGCRAVVYANPLWLAGPVCRYDRYLAPPGTFGTA
ncbi:Dihydroorotate dehydrogenase B (NAD(+)), electron transfer subunit [compost metagenome]